jgi:hypothetical protein
MSICGWIEEGLKDHFGSATLFSKNSLGMDRAK